PYPLCFFPTPLSFVSFSVLLLPPVSPLFPYTTLFRSLERLPHRRGHRDPSQLRHRSCRGRAAQFDWPIRSPAPRNGAPRRRAHRDRKSTRLNSSHVKISYAVFCLKKKNKDNYKRVI